MCEPRLSAHLWRASRRTRVGERERGWTLHGEVVQPSRTSRRLRRRSTPRCRCTIEPCDRFPATRGSSDAKRKSENVNARVFPLFFSLAGTYTVYLASVLRVFARVLHRLQYKYVLLHAIVSSLSGPLITRINVCPIFSCFMICDYTDNLQELRKLV